MTRLLLALLICFSSPLQAAWLALCDSQIQPPLPEDFRFTSTDGTAKVLRLLDHNPPESCSAAILPVSADAVQWFTPLSPGQAAQIGQSRAVVLQGTQSGKHFAGEVSLDGGTAAPPVKPLPWPLFLDLQEQLEITPFGVEERASVERSNTGVIFRCQAGRRPAGFVLPLGQDRLPQLPGLKLSLELQGDGDFTWAASQIDGGRDPLPLAKLQLNNGQHTEHIELAPMLQPQNNWNGWTLLCPETQANLTLGSMRLTAQTSAQRGRTTWLWRESDWRQADASLWQKLDKLNIATLYLTVPLSADLTRVENIPTVQAFITEAGKRGIDVWAVAGDPLAVLASERESWLKRAKAYADYNLNVEKSARLKGVQYDIEPYLAPGYAQAPEAWKQAYLDTLAALRKSSPLTLEAAVPIWWAEETVKDKPLLEAMAASVDGITVMDYRTDSWRIQQQALPFLDWGLRHGKSVHIALESGPVAEETRLLFHRAEIGNLWVTQVDGMTLLLCLTEAKANPGGIIFNLTRETAVSGEAVSFHGRSDEMIKTLPELEHAFGVWPSFAGLALHEVLAP